MFIFLYIGVVLLFFVILMLLTFGKKGWDYIGIDTVIANINNKFLVGLFVFLPAVVVFLLTIFTRNAPFAQYNWFIAGGIAIVRLITIIVGDRFHMVKIFPWLFMSALSIAVSYIACSAVMAMAPSDLFNNANTIVLIMWFVTVLIIGNLLSEAQFGSLDDNDSYNRNVDRLYRKYQKKFEDVIQQSFKRDLRKRRILFSIMIAEDINRPGIVRLVERMLFPFTHIATTGIMQVTASEYLSNSKSVEIAQEMVNGFYKRQKRKYNDNDYLLVRAIASDYNEGIYPELVVDIFFTLKDLEIKCYKKSIDQSKLT